MQQSSKISNNCAISALAHSFSAAGHWVPACTTLSFCHGRVIGGRWRVIWEEGWCETQWETHACVLGGPQVTCSRASAKLWQDQTECLSSMPLHPPTSPPGRAVSQRLSSLSPSHPFFKGILSSTHPSIWHSRDKQADTCILTHNNTQTCTFSDLADTPKNVLYKSINELCKNLHMTQKQFHKDAKRWSYISSIKKQENYNQ